MKLISITKSDRADKKYVALFDDNKRVHFGATGYPDFTTTNDEKRKDRYLKRHKKNEQWNNPQTAGSLSRYILWNKPTLQASIADYKHRFGL